MPSDGIQIIERGCLPPADDALGAVGGKAFNLIKLASQGFAVPPGFVLPTTMCADWIAAGPPSPEEFRALFGGAIDRLERAAGLGFGDARRPLLVSVRSGAPVSMPGMLDTVLNIGLTRATLPGLVASTGNPRLAWDCYVRLVQSYAAAVEGLDLAPFEALAGPTAELDTLSLRDLAQRHLALFEELSGHAFPDDPFEQLRAAVTAVFRSWDSERAKSYRRIHSLEGLPGTAVTVQRMVYGNAGPRSGAGVGFTRNPATGEKGLYLDFAFDAQGEDVVSGRRRLTPAAELARLMPRVAATLEQVSAQLEQVFLDAQDFEFTVEEGTLYLLQTREAKRSSWARLRVAADLVREGLIAPDEALQRLEGLDMATLVRRHVAAEPGEAIAEGVSAGIGVASGPIATTIEAARAMAAKGQPAILVRNDIATDDIDGIASAAGVLTARGGRTSHAAVVARELGKVAIVGCHALETAADDTGCRIAGEPFAAGAQITLDGEAGRVYRGVVAVREERPVEDLALVESWRHRAAARAG